jgi:uncharacterized RDD family membrane protein YckC
VTAPATGARPSARASLARRLGALAYEALLFVAIAFFAGFAILPFVSPARQAAPTEPGPLARLVMFALLVAGFGAYYAWCWSDGRRTLPQKTWRLRLVDARGGVVSARRALARYAAAWIAPALALAAYGLARGSGHAQAWLALALAGYVYALVDRDRQFLHDRIAGTYVVVDA